MWIRNDCGFAFAGAACPGPPSAQVTGLYVQSTGAAASCCVWSEVGLAAPANTSIIALSGQWNWNNQNAQSAGWTAGVMDQNNNWWIGGPSQIGSTGFGSWLDFGWNFNSSVNQIRLIVQCVYASCPSASGAYAYIALRYLTFTLANDSAPAIVNARGPLWSDGWVGGKATVSFDASDDTGIQSIRAYLDGQQKAADYRGCDPHALTCPDWGGATLSVPTYDGVSDGRHTLTIEAVDRAGNVAQASRTVRIDNTPPAAPQELAVDGGDGWRTSPKFTLRWTEPGQQAGSGAAARAVSSASDTSASIAGVEWKMCPAGKSTGCITGSKTQANITSLDLEVPKPGDWETSVWLRDSAGNAQPATAAHVRLRYDNDSPDVVFAAVNADDPARIHVSASDASSAIASGELSLRRLSRNGSWGHWRSYPGDLEPGGFSVMLDDEHLRDGYYQLAARAVDDAGNERSTDRTPDGSPASITLPVRLKTKLRAGKARRVRRGRHHRRRTIYRTRPRVRVGHRLRLHGRLTAPGGLPVAGASIQITSQPDLPGAAARPIATVTTSRTGRLTYLLAKGPARRLVVHYVGAAKIRSATRVVRVRVAASSTIHRSRRSVVNGEAVGFRGRLRGGWVPAQGKLVEVQFYARGKWRTFATTRTDATGRWHYTYRFDGTRGIVRWRFRARIPREAGYPYTTGQSHRVRVTVRGR